MTGFESPWAVLEKRLSGTRAPQLHSGRPSLSALPFSRTRWVREALNPVRSSWSAARPASPSPTPRSGPAGRAPPTQPVNQSPQGRRALSPTSRGRLLVWDCAAEWDGGDGGYRASVTGWGHASEWKAHYTHTCSLVLPLP